MSQVKEKNAREKSIVKRSKEKQDATITVRMM